MARSIRGGVLAGIAVAALWTASAALAATPGTPPPEPEPQPEGLTRFLPAAGLLLATIGVGVLAKRVLGVRRSLAAGGLVLLFLGGLVYVLAAFIGDFSGRHQILFGALAIGLAMIGVSVLGFVWLSRSKPRDAAPAGEMTDPP